MDAEEIAYCGRLPAPQSGVVERRVAKEDRRASSERRSGHERRSDNRLSPAKHHKSLKEWFRAVTHLRLGVDRRKSRDRRRTFDRRHAPHVHSLLTPEELADLLS